ncbi:ChaN family lipoprotein [Variovorax sp. KK3]|uniref:ChaN family lipoprotein n=1 Tax=Variovorax sp. KK3 TaxID=1855728 RepID=UPI00097BAFC5|nr:ChaN family lipoprotein [Variovorax sp. KK3]
MSLRPSRLPAPLALLLTAIVLAGCAARPESTASDAPVPRRALALLPADALLLGEQHDAPEHQVIERETVEALAGRNRLAAVAIEMAEEGQSTALMDKAATEAQVQAALNWNDKAWPWAAYGPAVMAAVRAGVPVLGANLPRARMKDAMADVSLDAQLNPDAHKAQQAAVRDGHCNLLPESQIGPMTRIQIARDRAMAQTILKARVPGKTVLLLSGAGHSAKALGVPQHLPSDMAVKTVQLQAGDAAAAPREPSAFDAVWRTPAIPEKDYCAALRAPTAPTAPKS